MTLAEIVAPPLALGPLEWGAVTLTCVIIFVIHGPKLLQDIGIGRVSGFLNVVALRTTASRIDVTELAPLVRAPTLVLHGVGDAAIPFDQGRRLAALIPGARFVSLDSINHILLEDEPAWPRFLDEVRRFLAEDEMSPLSGQVTESRRTPPRRPSRHPR